MDFFVPLIICLIVFIMCSICGWCCGRKKTRGAIFSTPVVITTSTTMPNQSGQMPYVGPPPSIPYQPVNQPQAAGFYPTQYPPYPGAQSDVQMPMPGTGMGYPHHTIPHQNPPSYSEAVTNEVYTKQSPYNPNYGGA